MKRRINMTGRTTSCPQFSEEQAARNLLASVLHQAWNDVRTLPRHTDDTGRGLAAHADRTRYRESGLHYLLVDAWDSSGAAMLLGLQRAPLVARLRPRLTDEERTQYAPVLAEWRG